ncbi:MAG TPA: hypothetical protein ENI23_11355 [bacterium]|nr:hypothetical protein [bacterium]
MIVCDECKQNEHVHRVQFGFSYYAELKGRKTEIMAFYGIHGEYCEKCIKKKLEKIGYKHEEPKIQLSDKEKENLK